MSRWTLAWGLGRVAPELRPLRADERRGRLLGDGRRLRGSPDPASLAFAWTVVSGTGTVSNNNAKVTADGLGGFDTATFTCPVTHETDVVQPVVGDGPLPEGGSCPATYTTGTLTITCSRTPCNGAGVLANPNAPNGTCPAGFRNTGTADAYGEYCCVQLAR